MNKKKYLLFCLLGSICFLFGMNYRSYGQAVFKKRMIAAESFESVAVFDVNNDNRLDIVSGSFWYEGPEFKNRHFIGHVKRSGPNGEYWSQFGLVPLDVNGDGFMDFVTGDWFSKKIWWRENPGDTGRWPLHIIDSTASVETVRGWDINGDGTIEIVPNTPGNPLKFYVLKKNNDETSSGKFRKVVVASTQGHGLGFGDINGDGRGDFIISKGWLEAPEGSLKGEWILHTFNNIFGEKFNLGTASIPVLIVDVDNDGDNDLIVGQAHSYGLAWFEQTTNKSGKRSWIKHPIDPFSSQYHTMEWADIDNDGIKELITGKRYRAHNGNDPGSSDPIGLYYFKWYGQSFTKYTISYGPLGVGKGTGLDFSIKDINSDEKKDIIVAGKDGLYVFYNKGS